MKMNDRPEIGQLNSLNVNIFEIKSLNDFLTLNINEKNYKNKVDLLICKNVFCLKSLTYLIFVRGINCMSIYVVDV